MTERPETETAGTADAAAAETLRETTAEAAPELAEHDALRAEIETARQETLYAQAEMQNLRRRTEREVADARTYATTGFARDLLSVADNLSRALAAVPEAARGDERLKGFLTGVEMTAKELDQIFSRNGVTRIEALGQPLDPNRHQAIVELEATDGQTPGTIVSEMQTGWMIRDRLLRPAMVGVAKAGSAKVDARA